ncbi:unnamed protein product [Tetraodon nigroviridis]|uniref:(spotted green pufferfish) hypothetical protein n=1 Tax=Tetraodon nigroviridis TaxID=99883 RepID=Q4SMN3_TETNG|nr:unnamed protein product [Tetraodon nigroviridis]
MLHNVLVHLLIAVLVVAELKASCESLSEEQLAKLGVILFNCEAESMGRQTYLCTEEMNGQLELKELTAASLDKLLDGHKALQTQQGKLYEGQELMEGSLRDNLQRLSQEKALIASGQELVAQLIEGIMQRMDSSMLEFLQYQDQTSHYYGDLMNKLERMNSTLGSMLHYIDNMQGRLEERLHIIQGYLGWAGLSLTAMWTCIAHAGYFAVAAVLMTFLHFSAFSRAVLLLSVPLNAVAEVNQQPALDLGSLSLLLLALSLEINWMFFWSQTTCYFRTALAQVILAYLQGPSFADSLNRSLGVYQRIPVISQLSGLHHSSFSGRQLCNGITKTGKACKKRAVPGQEYCRVHEGGHSSYVHPEKAQLQHAGQSWPTQAGSLL